MGRAGDHHVHPATGPTHRIEEDGICWCQPTVFYEDLVTGARVIVHKEASC